MGAPLAQRVLRHFTRQRQWLEDATRQANALCLRLRTDSGLAQEDSKHLYERQQRELETLVTEQHLMLREWEAAQDVPENLRRDVQAEAASLGELVKQVQQAQAELAETLGRNQERIQQERDALRQGRRVATKYHATHSSEGGDLHTRG